MTVEAVKTAVSAILQGDATFAGLMVGGIYDDVKEIKRDGITAAAFDANDEVLTCALVKSETAVPFGVHDHSARMFLVIYVYSLEGIGVIGQAIDRAYQLLHRKCITSGGVWDCKHADEERDSEDPILECDMGFTRFVLVINRES
jgi:hypothetical protein